MRTGGLLFEYAIKIIYKQHFSLAFSFSDSFCSVSLLFPSLIPKIIFYIPNKFSPFFIISFAASAGAGVVATLLLLFSLFPFFSSLIHQIFMRYSIINRHSQHTLRIHTKIHSAFKLPNKISHYNFIIPSNAMLQQLTHIQTVKKKKSNIDDDHDEQQYKIIVIRPYAHSLITYIGN